MTTETADSWRTHDDREELQQRLAAELTADTAASTSAGDGSW